MILLKSLKVKIQGSKISKTRARESGVSVFSSFLFPKAAASAKRAIQQAGKNWGSLRGKIFARLLSAEGGMGWESVSAIPASAGRQNRKIFVSLIEKILARRLIQYGGR